VQPTYLRHERMAGLYLDKAKDAGEPTSKKRFYSLALLESEKSLQRHPYYAVAMADKATALWQLHRYQDADDIFRKLVKWVESRQKFFHTYVIWADCLTDWANSMKDDQKRAKELEIRALNLWEKAGYKSNQYSYNVLNRITLSLARLASNSGDLDGVSQILDHYYRGHGRSGFNRNNPEILVSHALFLLKHSMDLFYKRKPESAYKWVLKSNQYFTILKKKFPNVAKKYKSQHTQALKQIKFFKETHTMPAK